MIAFGPVPSRRLGRSLGINNIPPKVCTYSCVYCQVGKTHRLQVERRPFYEPEDINVAFQVFHERLDQVEYLIGYEGNAFAFTGNVEEDLLSITSVHPMRESAVREFLKKAGADWSVAHQLIVQSKLVETEYAGQKFYLRNPLFM